LETSGSGVYEAFYKHFPGRTEKNHDKSVNIDGNPAQVFWVVMPCSGMVGYRRFGGFWCLHPKDGSSKVLPHHYTVWKHRKLRLWPLAPWKPQESQPCGILNRLHPENKGGALASRSRFSVTVVLFNDTCSLDGYITW